MTTAEVLSIQKIMDKFIAEMRPPVAKRAQLDIGYKIEAQSIFIVEIRPQWNDPTIIREFPFAKATFVRTQNHWKIFWLRSTGNWQGCSPMQEVLLLSSFTEIVKEDAHHCFWG